MDVLDGVSRQNRFKRLLVFMGPAFIASVAYVDPGNFATNIQGGAQFGYMLLWVIVASNLMAMLIQTLSAKLGLATGMNLAEHCRTQFPKSLVWTMWGVMELVAMATDLAEFLGAAIGFNLLFGTPLWVAGLITALVTFLILGLNDMASVRSKPSSPPSWASLPFVTSSKPFSIDPTGLPSCTAP